MSRQRARILVHGAVQGVGFRPFVYRLATQLGLGGMVINSTDGVSIEVEGDEAALESFTARLCVEKPPRAVIGQIEQCRLEPRNENRFGIGDSCATGSKSAAILPDLAACDECLAEVSDPKNRRYLYPFTNCTNCGPRFSIIEALPYDRANTSMKRFTMCAHCRREYGDVSDRRYHAQPNACPVCGPHLELWTSQGEVLTACEAALSQAVEAIKSGLIVAIKGIGGFQFIVDARNSSAVRRLRRRT